MPLKSPSFVGKNTSLMIDFLPINWYNLPVMSGKHSPGAALMNADRGSNLYQLKASLEVRGAELCDTAHWVH